MVFLTKNTLKYVIFDLKMVIFDLKMTTFWHLEKTEFNFLAKSGIFDDFYWKDDIFSRRSI